MRGGVAWLCGGKALAGSSTRLVLERQAWLARAHCLTCLSAARGMAWERRWNAAWPVAEMVSYLVNVMSAQLLLFRKMVLEQVQAAQLKGPPPPS